MQGKRHHPFFFVKKEYWWSIDTAAHHSYLSPSFISARADFLSSRTAKMFFVIITLRSTARPIASDMPFAEHNRGSNLSRKFSLNGEEDRASVLDRMLNDDRHDY